jgi:hypothetical protein
MIARSVRWAFGLAACLTLVSSFSAASACDHCNGGGGMRGRSYSSFSDGDYDASYGPSYDSGGCSSCGGGHCRDASCYNEPKGCRNCPPNPDKTDCCNPCSRKTVFGCGWRTWDFFGQWSCDGGCASCVGCGEIYRGDYASDPPVCCDPCDGHGNWIGPGSGYRAHYNPSQYGGGNYYDYSSDYTYSAGESNNQYQEPARMGSVVRSQPTSAPSRLVPSGSARKPSTNIQRQAWQTSQRNMQR